MSEFDNVSAKASRLDAVFKKAIDVAANSLNESDLEESFGEIRGQFGGSMSKLFINLVGRTQSNIEASYKDISVRREIVEKLQLLEQVDLNVHEERKVPAQENVEDPLSQPLQDPIVTLLPELKSMEVEAIRSAVEKLNEKVTSLRQRSQKLHGMLEDRVQNARQEVAKQKKVLVVAATTAY